MSYHTERIKTDPVYKRAKQLRSKKWDSANRKRRRGLGKAWRAANPEKVRVKNRTEVLGRRGLTLAAFNSMLSRQKGLCAICKSVLQPGKKTHIDHDHVAGKNRALLCGTCNLGLGMFRDNPKTLRLAAKYLEFHNKEN